MKKILPTPKPSVQPIPVAPTPTPSAEASPSPSPSPDVTDEPTDEPSGEPSPSASPTPTTSSSPKLAPPVLPTPPLDLDPKKITYVDPENPPTVDPKKFSEPPASPVIITEQPKFGELKENPNGTFTYIPDENSPKTPTVDVVTFEYTALSGATIVVRQQFILVEKGDVPSLIQTGYGSEGNNFGFLFLLISIALVLHFGRKVGKNA